MLIAAVFTTCSADKNATQNQNAVAQTATCDKYASTKGSDEALGTRTAPYRSVQHLVDLLRPGQTGCIRGGTYVPGNKVLLVDHGGTSDSNRIVVQNYPGEKVTIRAQVKVNPGGNYVTFRSSGGLWNLVLDGTGGPIGSKPTNQGRRNTEGSPTIHANRTEWIGLDITKRNRELSSSELYKTGVCVHIGSSNIPVWGTVIEKSRIHNCGVRKGQHDESYVPNFFGRGKDLDNRGSGSPDNHGMYLSNTSGTTTIKDNLIYDNGERGVQLYPDAHGVLIEGNVVDGNGDNIVFSGRGNTVSSRNTVRDNVISNARVGWNVSSNWNQTSKVGWDNKVYDNCVWASDGLPNGGISPKEQGFDAHDNLIAKPAYVDPKAGNFELGHGDRCSTMLDKQGGVLRKLISSLSLVDP